MGFPDSRIMNISIMVRSARGREPRRKSGAPNSDAAKNEFSVCPQAKPIYDVLEFSIIRCLFHMPMHRLVCMTINTIKLQICRVVVIFLPINVMGMKILSVFRFV